jgi:RNA polymerase sigma-70 factor (ECF subfamily)
MATAKRQALDAIRASRTHRKFADDLTSQLESDWTLRHTVEREFEELRIKDDQLRLIFMCAGAELTPENRIPLILRSLSGFSIPAISRALLLPEATVKKRLVRSREYLKGRTFELPSHEHLAESLESVHTVIYLLFNEGFHSTDGVRAMNLELCREAIHLAGMLAQDRQVANQETFALLALMKFHLSRASTRVDVRGFNVPIDLQRRADWDQEAIAEATSLLRLSETCNPPASGRFVIEARIAAQHCLAPRFSETNWHAIVWQYELLVAVTESPVARLNHAVAVGYAGDLAGAIQRVEVLRSHELLRASPLPAATLAHFFAKLGDEARAEQYVAESCALGGTSYEQQLLQEQVERLLSQASGSAPPPESSH